MSPPRLSVKSLVVAAAGAAVAVAAVVDTPFLTPEEVLEINPPPFSAEQFAAEQFPVITEDIAARATDLTELAPAIVADPAAAGAEYGTNIGGGKFAYPVRATGTVAEADEDWLTLQVDGLPPESVVRVPLGAGLSGTPIRDAGGLEFSDFPGQTEYQSTANALEQLLRAEVVSGIDPAAVTGQEVTVVGAWNSGGPPNSYVIHPVEFEVAS